MAVLMFCGELDGKIVTLHLFHRAGDVRDSVGIMMNDWDAKRGWREAIKLGWRVAKVRVEKLAYT